MRVTTVDIVVPVYNEERALPQSIPTLCAFLESDAFPYDWTIFIGDNASIDNTPAVSRKLEEESGGRVKYVRVERKGRGYALKEIWGGSQADILSFMDVDLSTGIDAFPELIGAIAEKGYDIAIGSRLASRSKVTRSFKRTVLTRGYNAIIKAMFFTRFSDAQCGFKAVSREAAQRLLPLIENNNWFFDTEMLILARRWATGSTTCRWSGLRTRIRA